MPAAPVVIRLDPRDNVVVALRALEPGEVVVLEGGAVVPVVEAVPAGHKVATTAIEPVGDVVKYGEVIGLASAEIPAGAHVHVHNVVSVRLPGGAAT